MRFLFFDAGNTLVFPDHSCTLRPLLAAGFKPDTAQLDAAERVAKRLLMDVDGAYSERGLARVESLEELPALL